MNALNWKPGRYEFTSETSGRRYVLTVPLSGQEDDFTCTCRGFKGAGHCVHVEDTLLFGEIPDSKIVRSAVGGVRAAVTTTNANNNTTKENTMKKTAATTAKHSPRKVVRIKKTDKVETAAPTPRRRRNSLPFPLDVPVNVKVAGERAMRKHVVLVRHESDPSLVRVLTGSRGRPSHLAVADIEKVRAL